MRLGDGGLGPARQGAGGGRDWAGGRVGPALGLAGGWRRGAGRIFYFQGGHETYPIYYQSEVQRVIVNAIHWAAQRECEVELKEARHCKVTPNELAGI